MISAEPCSVFSGKVCMPRLDATCCVRFSLSTEEQPGHIAGAKSRDDIYGAFEKIYPVLEGFRKGDAPNPSAVGVLVLSMAVAVVAHIILSYTLRLVGWPRPVH